VPSKRRFLQEPHGVTSQNTAFFLFSLVGLVRAIKCISYKMEYNEVCVFSYTNVSYLGLFLRSYRRAKVQF
jgi:hypothetical protein